MSERRAIESKLSSMLPSDVRSVALFPTLTVAFSAVFWALMIASGHLGASGARYLVGLMWPLALLVLFYRRNVTMPAAEGETAMLSARLSADAARGG